MNRNGGAQAPTPDDDDRAREAHVPDDATRGEPSKARRALAALVRLAVGFALVFVVAAMLFEENLIFFPSRYPAGDYDAPRREGVPCEDVWLVAEDGVKIHGWYLPAPSARCTILYFHGNAGNLGHRFGWMRALTRLRANVLGIDYRGYGRSAGRPDEAGIYRDARAAYAWLTGEKKVDPKRIVVYGKSLGGAAACELASTAPCAGLVTQSTFTSAPAMARVLYPFPPLAWLIHSRLDNLAKVARIDAPKLFIHSKGDEMIPYRMAEALHAAAKAPKRLALFEGSGHNALIGEQTEALLATFRAFLDEVTP